MSQYQPMCAVCRHWTAGTAACAAFPAGIPDDILHYRADHRQPYEGDGGLHFEPNGRVEPEELRFYGDLLDRALRAQAAST